MNFKLEAFLYGSPQFTLFYLSSERQRCNNFQYLGKKIEITPIQQDPDTQH
jgi:hypothetical protein